MDQDFYIKYLDISAYRLDINNEIIKERYLIS